MYKPDLVSHFKTFLQPTKRMMMNFAALLKQIEDGNCEAQRPLLDGYRLQTSPTNECVDRGERRRNSGTFGQVRSRMPDDKIMNNADARTFQ